MNLPLVMAASLVVMLSIIHSVLGERMVFGGLEGRLARYGDPALSMRQVAVLRGVWHVLTLFGLGLGFMLFTLALPSLGMVISVPAITAVTCFIIGIYWGYATRLWHPAWIVFLLIAALCWWA